MIRHVHSGDRGPPRAPRRFAFFVLLAMLATVLQRPAVAADDNVLRARLDNGLEVVIVRNDLAAVVTTAVNYRVGADETPPGFPGMAHAQEHMMFRGSPGLSADQLANIGSLMGGNFNADTRQTVTQYFFTVPAEDLDVALHVEALRMRGVFDNDKDWRQERGAIEQEVAQDLSNPRYVLFTKLRAAMFRGTSYEHDALGSKSSFYRTTGRMLKAFHDKWYAPNNAVLVVVGQLDPAATLAQIRQLFGDIPARRLPERGHIKLQPVEPQSLSLKTDLPYAMQVVAMRMPGLDSPDYAAIEVLADVLNSQRGELYGMVPKGTALGTDFSLETLPKAGLAYATAVFPVAGDAKAVLAEMRGILARIARDGVPADLVAAAKLQERRAAEFQKNSIEGLATVWSEAVAVDGLASPEEDLTRIEKVSVEDVNRVARKYLDLDHTITALLTPQGSGKPIAGKGFGGQENIALQANKPARLPDWAEQALHRLRVPESSVRPVVSQLPNGVTLIVQPESVSDTVSVFGRFKGRPELTVPKGKEGLSEVLDQLFSYGSDKLDRVAFQQALDKIGADEQAGSQFSIQVLSEHFDRAVELLAGNELHPALPETAFEIVKHQVAQSVAGRLESPGYLARHALRQVLFPTGDATLREARPETVEALTRADVVNYFHATYRPDLAVIVVVGKVTPEQARAAIEKHFGGWTATGPKPETNLPPVPANLAGIREVPDSSRVQDSVTLAETLGLTRSHPDYYALELGNTVLGGSFYSTRLTRDLRKEAGLVYTVDSEFIMSQTRGIYLVDYACDPRNVSRVQNIVLRELHDMQQTPVTADELARAKAVLLRRIPLEEASIGGIAEGLAERWSRDLPLDEPTRAAQRYLSLGAAEVQAAFAKWLRPQDLARVSQGPAPE